jgi:pimeloyl-ACP methyl ester carboxylesterase
MLKSLFGAMTGKVAPAGRALKPVPAAVELKYRLSRNRWHLDSRDPMSMVLVHDILRCGDAMSPYTTALTRLPITGSSPLLPLDTYMPDLRNHGRSPASDDSSLLASASDLLRFTDRVVEFNSGVHLVGVGHGAWVALATALLCPTGIASVTAIDPMTLAEAKAATVSTLQALRQLPPVQGSSLASMSQHAAKLIPSERERLELLLSYEERTPVNGGAKWRGSWDTIEKQLDAVHAWPTVLEGLSFAGPVVLISHRKAPVTSVQALGIDQHAFTTVDTVTVASSRGADEVIDTVLRKLDLHGTVDALQEQLVA